MFYSPGDINPALRNYKIETKHPGSAKIIRREHVPTGLVGTDCAARFEKEAKGLGSVLELLGPHAPGSIPFMTEHECQA